MGTAIAARFLLVIASTALACGPDRGAFVQDAGAVGDRSPAAIPETAPPSACRVGLGPGQVDQTGCPEAPNDFHCPNQLVCVYPTTMGTEIVDYCDGMTFVTYPSSCSGQCPDLLASLNGSRVSIDHASCADRPAMDCALQRGLSEQDVVTQWVQSLVETACPGLVENKVVVTFEGGCATELRFARAADVTDFSVCLAEKLSAVRWTCNDLACAWGSESTLP